MKYFATAIETDKLCCLGCGQQAKFIRKNQKVYCSDHSNKCPEKRRHYSEDVDHSERDRKSLATRTRLGITKSSQIKGGKTRRESGHYIRLAERMRELMTKSPWNTNPKWSYYKTTKIPVQSSYELEFLESLEKEHGFEWVEKNVFRGGSFRYIDPNTQKERLYLPDFKIENIIYEIKGKYTWDGNGKNIPLGLLNIAKLDCVVEQGYNIVLVLEGQHISWKENGSRI